MFASHLNRDDDGGMSVLTLINESVDSNDLRTLILEHRIGKHEHRIINEMCHRKTPSKAQSRMISTEEGELLRYNMRFSTGNMRPISRSKNNYGNNNITEGITSNNKEMQLKLKHFQKVPFFVQMIIVF